MAEDDERKKIAELYFGTDKAEKGLIRIEERFKKLNTVSENYIKMMQKGFGNSDIYKSLNIGKISNLTNAQLKDINKQQVKLDQKSAYNWEKIQQKKTLITHQEAEKRATAEIKANLKVEKSSKTMYDKIADYAKTYLIYQGFNELRQQAKELVDEMVNVEYQMVQIDRVLNDSSLNINDYRDQLIQLAYDYGNSFENVADITLRLAQAGFDAQESLALTEKTLLALNTAELNATQATDDMVAIMAQWGLMTGTATEQAEAYSEIIDKINITADNFPTTSTDIMEAMKKTSSAFKLAGMDIDETIAIIVSAEKASQRGGKAIGTALSNISQQLKETSRIDIAKDLGIDFFKDANKTEYKDLVDILGELSAKMEQLKASGKESSVEMQNLLKVFTVFRRNIGASLLGEMSGEDSTYQQVINILGDPDTIGYSMRENEKHMRTAKAAMEQFNAELLKFKTNVWDNGVEDVFRTLLLLGSDVVNVLNILVETFGSVPTVLGLVVLSFAAFNKKLQLVQMNSKGTGLEFSNFMQSIKNAIVQTKTMNATMDTAVVKTNLLKVAVVGLNAVYSLGLSLAITAVISGLDYLIHKEEKAVEKTEEQIRKSEEIIEQYVEEKDSIEELIEKYSELNSLEANERTVEQSEELKKIQKEITTILKENGKEIFNFIRIFVLSGFRIC